MKCGYAAELRHREIFFGRENLSYRGTSANAEKFDANRATHDMEGPNNSLYSACLSRYYAKVTFNFRLLRSFDYGTD